MTVCLSMIVRDENPVIARCLASVRPIIDHWVIVDTGSTDGTQQLIRQVLHDIPGTLHQRPWQDFATNRNEALELARPQGDYLLFIDADDVLEYRGAYRLPLLEAASYDVQTVAGGITYVRTQLVKSSLPWRWHGVLHEFLACDTARDAGQLTDIRIRRNHDGARRRAGDTYRRDVALLQDALRTERAPFMRSRYTFYLAQSHRDAGDRQSALEVYLARAELGFWDEEIFISLLYAARIMEELGHPPEEVLRTYARATSACPRRAEARHGAGRLCARLGRHREGYAIAAAGLDLALPQDALFLEPWIYEFGLRDEFAVCAYWSGAYRICLDACLTLVESGKLPPADMARVSANARMAMDQLPHDPELGALGRESLIEQHELQVPRGLHSRRGRNDAGDAPRVMLAILAKQKAAALPLYLDCVEALDYPKASIVLYVRTNNNTDATEQILRAWLDRVGHLYGGIEFDATDVAEPVQRFDVHEWNPLRFRVLGRIRNASLRCAQELACDFYFVADVDNFLRPETLRELVALDLPIVAPFLRSIEPGAFYSNYHAEIDVNGYYQECDQYHWVLNRTVRGVLEMPVVHCTYLVRGDVLQDLTYEDGSDRYEYVVFSDSARRSGILQYIDNRQVYGYITFGDGHGLHVADGIGHARVLLANGRHEPAAHGPGGDALSRIGSEASKELV